MLLLLSLTACSGKTKLESSMEKSSTLDGANTNLNMSAEDTVKSALDALIILNTKQFNKCVNYHYADTRNGVIYKDNILFSDNIDEQNKELIKEIVSNISYKIKKTTESGDTATVELQIINRDFSNLCSGLISETLSGEENKLIELVKNTKQKKEYEITLSLAKSNNLWRINMNKEFANAILGGINYMDFIFNS